MLSFVTGSPPPPFLSVTVTFLRTSLLPRNDPVSSVIGFSRYCTVVGLDFTVLFLPPCFGGSSSGCNTLTRGLTLERERERVIVGNMHCVVVHCSIINTMYHVHVLRAIALIAYPQLLLFMQLKKKLGMRATLGILLLYLKSRSTI